MRDSRIKRFLQGSEKPSVKATVILYLTQLIAAILIALAIARLEDSLSWIFLSVGITLFFLVIALALTRMHYDDKRARQRIRFLQCIVCESAFNTNKPGRDEAERHLNETGHAGFRFAYYNQVTRELVE